MQCFSKIFNVLQLEGIRLFFVSSDFFIINHLTVNTQCRRAMESIFIHSYVFDKFSYSLTKREVEVYYTYDSFSKN